MEEIRYENIHSFVSSFIHSLTKDVYSWWMHRWLTWSCVIRTISLPHAPPCSSWQRWPVYILSCYQIKVFPPLCKSNWMGTKRNLKIVNYRRAYAEEARSTFLRSYKACTLHSLHPSILLSCQSNMNGAVCGRNWKPNANQSKSWVIPSLWHCLLFLSFLALFIFFFFFLWGSFLSGFS